MKDLKELKFYISVYGRDDKGQEVRISRDTGLTIEQVQEFINQFKTNE